MRTTTNPSDDGMRDAAVNIAEYAYSLQDQLPEEERWGMTSALRRQAFTMTTDIAEAAGSHDPRDRMHYYGLARKELSGLKNTLTFAKRLDYIRLEPEKMLAIEELIKKLDGHFDSSRTDIPTYLAQFESNTKTEKKS